MKNTNTRNALVVGASSDLGTLITQDLLTQGYHVLAHYGRNLARLQSIEHPNLTVFQADLTDFSQAQALAARSAQLSDGLDVLINLVGPLVKMDLLEMTPEQWRQSVELNLNVAFTMTHYTQTQVTKRQGHILNFAYAGVEDVRAWRSATAYAAAKAGLAVLTKSLAVALAPRGVRVNAIAPGYLDFGEFSEIDLNQIRAQIPQGRLGLPQEIIEVTRWVLTQSPKYLNGAIIPVGGAWEHLPT